jgi:hypothetical protein
MAYFKALSRNCPEECVNRENPQSGARGVSLQPGRHTNRVLAAYNSRQSQQCQSAVYCQRKVKKGKAVPVLN